MFTVQDIQNLDSQLRNTLNYKLLPENDVDVTDDMLNEYADNLYNYIYTYKPEATAFDSSLNPVEEHKGPMAQDIEKVAPDCIKETPEGIKTVDGNRLALINAGLIGALARRVLQLEEYVYGTEFNDNT